MEKTPEKHKIEQNPEKEKNTFYITVLQKHPQSAELYKLRTKISDSGERPNFEKIIKASSNPFSAIHGKEIFYQGKKVGNLEVKEDLFSQCVYGKDGMMKCGFFYQVEAELPAPSLEAEIAKELVLEAIGSTNNLDYIAVDDSTSGVFPKILETSDFFEQRK